MCLLARATKRYANRAGGRRVTVAQWLMNRGVGAWRGSDLESVERADALWRTCAPRVLSATAHVYLQRRIQMYLQRRACICNGARERRACYHRLWLASLPSSCLLRPVLLLFLLRSVLSCGVAQHRAYPPCSPRASERSRRKRFETARGGRDSMHWSGGGACRGVNVTGEIRL